MPLRCHLGSPGDWSERIQPGQLRETGSENTFVSLASSHGIQSFPFAHVPGPTASPASPASLASLAKPAQKTAFLLLLLLMGFNHFPLPVCPGTRPAQSARPARPASRNRLRKHVFLSCSFSCDSIIFLCLCAGQPGQQHPRNPCSN